MKTLKLFTILAVMVAFLVTGAWAENQKPVAQVNVGSYGLNWSPTVSYSKLVLTVSTPEGQVFRRVFDAGANPSFDLSQLEPPVLDGSYNYELRVIPVLPIADLQRGEKLGFEKKRPGSEPLTQSGHFHVKNGAIVNPNVSEGPSRTADQVINDDLIVTFSACFGNDCVNGESFGFDTLRLKENNLRIHFQDTSNSASFPTNDWRIVINDSSNGGGNYFAVEDSNAGRQVFRVDAGAPANSLRVDSGGDVGIGTSNPVVDLHVVSGNTPTLRLEQDGSSGFTPQTWDVAGNEANFFIRDATNGSKLPFKIKPGAPTSSIFIAADGDVGIGGESNTAGVQFEVHDSADTYIAANRGSGGTIAYFSAADTYAAIGAATNDEVRFVTSGSTKMTLFDNGRLEMSINGGYYDEANGDWINGSSKEYKENIENLDASEAIEAVEKLNPVTFKMKVAPKGDRQVGFIAEDVPELVAKRDRKGLSPMDIVAVLTKVVQEQQKQLKQQQNTISELNNRLSKIEKKK